MKRFHGLLLGVLILMPSFLLAQDNEFTKYEMSFKNFLTCELTRTDARNHFKGKSFKITMIDLFDIQRESGMVIVTGAVQCFVEDRYQTLYAALGVETIIDKEKVSYYTVRESDFSILATELIRFPYKERCPWSRYWVDTD
ncbi:MAG: hypothetical protein KKF12_14130 [Proteobacteria bacterium]|nr:hypothetical protein [Desulfobacula sp.]MBU4131954.1 hypothetical protein [Pseudomonadota bacterium]